MQTDGVGEEVSITPQDLILALISETLPLHTAESRGLSNIRKGRKGGDPWGGLIGQPSWAEAAMGITTEV